MKKYRILAKSIADAIWQLTRNIISKFLKNWVIVLISVSVVTVCYWTLLNHYKTFNFNSNSDFVYLIESKILDLRMMIRGPIKDSGKVGILAIDEKSLDKFGRWPFSRRYYEQAFKNLKELGVKWIGFDSIYSEPERTSLVEATSVFEGMAQAKNRGELQVGVDSLRAMLEESPSDQIFAEGIRNFEHVVLGYFFFGSEWEAKENLGSKERFAGLDRMLSSAINMDMPEGRHVDSYPLLRKAHGLVPNTPLISESSEHFAFFSNDADDDAINRWIVLLANTNGNLMPSLSLKTAAEYMNRDIFVFFDNLGIESVALVNRDNDEDVIELPIDPLGSGRMLLNHLGPGRSFHHYSLVDAYNNTFTEEEKEKLQNSVLLLGATATGINDMRPNPFDPSIDGVENHAAMMENILTNNFLKRPISIYQTELMIVLAVGLLFAPLMIFGKALFSGMAVVLFIIGYYYVDKYFWFERGIWTYMAIPIIEILTMFISTTLYKYMTEEAEKKKVKGAFQHYLSPEVINQVLDNPDSLKLGGEKKELTVFFSDVRGFTTISESLSPEKLCELMNHYFTPMTSIILKSGGVLDKYIGDAIMAFWGAPISIPQAPDVAVQASIDMLYALDELMIDFKKRGFPVVDIGIGLNTGPMSVGNMGSNERFTYTVMGDSVNLGARLEGLTKEYGIKLMISEFTYAKVTKDKFFIRDLDDIRVKGKTEPVKVFHVLRPDFMPMESQIREFIGNFEAGRMAYSSQKWEGAKKYFNNCLQMKPDDKSSALYMDRVDSYLKQSPGVAWDGVYTFSHK